MTDSIQETVLSIISAHAAIHDIAAATKEDDNVQWQVWRRCKIAMEYAPHKLGEGAYSVPSGFTCSKQCGYAQTLSEQSDSIKLDRLVNQLTGGLEKLWLAAEYEANNKE